jgi:hypothetical protein
MNKKNLFILIIIILYSFYIFTNEVHDNNFLNNDIKDFNFKIYNNDGNNIKNKENSKSYLMKFLFIGLPTIFSTICLSSAIVCTVFYTTYYLTDSLIIAGMILSWIFFGISAIYLFFAILLLIDYELYNKSENVDKKKLIINSDNYIGLKILI